MSALGTVALFCFLALACSQTLNLTPVIGIISIPMESWGPDPTTSYIAACYVKMVEAGGARVIPIPWDAANFTDYLSVVNGILFTGGDSTVFINGTQFQLTPFGQAL